MKANEDSIAGRASFERLGVDVRAALAAARNVGEAPKIALPAAPSALPVATAIPFKSRVKAQLRRVAGVGYRASKPFLRPLMFRLRAYFTAPLIAELQRSAEQERQWINSGEFLERRLADFAMHQLQELQYTRDVLRREILTVANELASDRSAEQLARIESYAYTAARRVALPCGPNEILLRTSIGYMVCSATDKALIATLLEGGEVEREPGVRILLQRLLRPGDCFVDVGANLGMYAVAAGFAMQGRGRIVAFEACPRSCDLLRQTLFVNGFHAIAEVHEVAASDHEGLRAFDASATNDQRSSHLSEPTLASHNQCQVALRCIDGVLGAGAGVDLLMIQVDCAAPDALGGACETLAANPEIAVVVRFDIAHSPQPKAYVADWLRAFREYGLEAAVVNRNSGVVETQPIGDRELQHPHYMFFARPSSSAWDRAQSSR